jgi:predicted nucleic acid-binding protein
VVQKAIAVLEAHPVRAMDAIHIGAALVCAADAFISADVRQCAAARLLGLQVVAL